MKNEFLFSLFEDRWLFFLHHEWHEKAIQHLIQLDFLWLQIEIRVLNIYRLEYGDVCDYKHSTFSGEIIFAFETSEY